jgi:ABC-type transport system involved in cytochrome c biogenesis permease component
MPNINGAILTSFGFLFNFFASLFLGGTRGHLLIPLLVLPI